MVDGKSAPSRVVGSTFERPAPPPVDTTDDSSCLDEITGRFGLMDYTIKVNKATTFTKADVQKQVDALFNLVDTCLNNYNDSSEISLFNNLAKNVQHEMSPTLHSVMDSILHLNIATKGLFDPAASPDRGTNWSNVKVRGNVIEKTDDSVKIDLGGISKGFFLDTLVDKLAELGCTSVYADWAGDIKVLGTHPSGREWVVAVIEPLSVDVVKKRCTDSTLEDYLKTPDLPVLQYIKLRSGCGLTTSGDYMQVKLEGDVLTSHIIEPNTGKRVVVSDESVCQATIVAKDCIIADALATAAIAMGDLKAAKTMLERVVGLRCMIENFVLFVRNGPQIVQHVLPGAELQRDREIRLQGTVPCQVLIVGAGLAGLCAAIEAAERGARVTILEKEPRTGGNSAKATSGINAWGTRFQVESDIIDDERYFERDTFRSAIGGNPDKNLVRTLSTQSSHAVHWLANKFNIDLSMLSQLGGHSRRRTHRVPPQGDGKPVPVGYFIMNRLREFCETKLADKITIRTNCKVTRLVYEMHRNMSGDMYKCVNGVEFTNANGDTDTICADATVLATGGFSFDTDGEDSLMKKHRPDMLGMPTTNGSWATGDGIRLVEELGVNLVDMDKVQLHPTGFIDPKDPGNLSKYLAPEAVRGSGAILLNQSGRRFINELDLRSVVARGILDMCEPYPMDDGSKGQTFAWCVLNDEGMEKFGREPFLFYKDRLGLFETVVGVQGLASLLGCQVEAIQRTLQEYQEAGHEGMCSATGKNVFPSKFEVTKDGEADTTEYHVARITPSIHYCMGGIAINPAGEVLESINEGGQIFGKRRHIRRLFAAGEVTGGVHGENRLGGNSLLECVVFGRIVGDRAATVNQKELTCLKRSSWTPCTLREVRYEGELYGHNTVGCRFNLHGQLQTSGLQVGQFVALRGEMDGETLVGYYSPITRPEDEGVIGILCRTDARGGPLVGFLNKIRPGNTCYIKAMGGFSLSFQNHGKILCNNTKTHVEEIGLIAGGTGIAPMVQIIRSVLRHKIGKEVGDFSGQQRRRSESQGMGGHRISNTMLNLVYAAEEPEDLAYVHILEEIQRRHPKEFRFYVVLNKPPLGWCGGVGFINADTLKKYMFYPPAPHQIAVICGPPIFERIMSKTLEQLGFASNQYYAFSQDD